jgi:hypothetical protein
VNHAPVFRAASTKELQTYGMLKERQCTAASRYCDSARTRYRSASCFAAVPAAVPAATYAAER